MRTRAMLLALLAAVACGRSDLLPLEAPPDASVAPPDSGKTATPDASRAEPPADASLHTSCGAPDPTTPLRVYEGDPQEFGGVAGSGCSFGMVWMENHGPLPLRARTANVVDGAWTLSPVVTIAANVNDDGGIATIGWDGSAYTVAWVNESRLFLRRMAADGTILGPAVRSVETGPDSYPLWVDPSPADGTLRMLLLDDRKSMYAYHLYFLKVAFDGTSPFAAVDLTPDAENVDFSGVAQVAAGANLLFWVDDTDPVGEALRGTAFDDLGRTTQPVEPIVPRFDGLLPGGLVSGGGQTLFGAWRDETRRSPPLVGILQGEGPGYTVVPGIAGGDSPLLARLADGTVGVLAGGNGAISGGSDLSLSFVVDGATTGTEVVARGEATSGQYEIAAGGPSFGLYWEPSSMLGLKLTIRTP